MMEVMPKMTVSLLYLMVFFVWSMPNEGLNGKPETTVSYVTKSKKTVVQGLTISPVNELSDVMVSVITQGSDVTLSQEPCDVTMTSETKMCVVTLTTEIQDAYTSPSGVTTSYRDTMIVDLEPKSGNIALNIAPTTESVILDPSFIINEGTLSKEVYDKCNLVLVVVVKPIVCIGGIIMNVIGFCVLLQKQFRRSTYTYLIFLALSDIISLLTSFLTLLSRYIAFYDDVIANVIGLYLYPYNTIFLSTSFVRVTEYIICALALERFFAVLYPFKIKELFLCRHAFPVCVGSFIFCLLAHTHFLFVYYPKPYFSLSRNITMWTLGRQSWYSALGVQPIYNMIYEVVFLYIPIVVLVTCNIGILIRVRQINKERRNIVANDAKSDKMSNDEKKITTTLIIISLTFLSVFLPIVMITVVGKFNKEFILYGREHYLLSLLIDIFGLGWNLSSANDFIIYIFTSKQFKQALTDMVCTSKKKRKKFNSNGPFTIDSQDITAVTETGSEGISLKR